MIEAKKELKDYLHLYKDVRVIIHNKIEVSLLRVEEGEAYVKGDSPIFTGYYELSGIKPILRPLSSMTEEEGIALEDEIWGDWQDPKSGDIKEIRKMFTKPFPTGYRPGFTIQVSMINWLRKKHFDVDGLIDSGLAIEQQKPL